MPNKDFSHCTYPTEYNTERSAKAFRTKKEKNRYFILLFIFIGIGLLAAIGLLVYDNPVPVTSSSFRPVVKRRVSSVIAMVIGACCHSLATISFQTVTNNKIVTPSLLGFEAVYSFIHTAMMYFFGIAAFQTFDGVDTFLFQIGIMVVVCLILYGTLLTGRMANMHFMLLVGIVLGNGLKSFSTFLRRLLSPSEFDILQARLFASINHADSDYFPIAIPLIVIAGIALLMNSNKLNAISLGKDVSTNIGLDHNKEVIKVLVFISILMSVSTALIGPLTFYGFLIAALTYQIVPSYDHKYLFPMGIALGFLILTSAYFIMNHVFYAQGVVSIIIEMVGGIVFLIFILKKGSL